MGQERRLSTLEGESGEKVELRNVRRQSIRPSERKEANALPSHDSCCDSQRREEASSCETVQRVVLEVEEDEEGGVGGSREREEEENEEDEEQSCRQEMARSDLYDLRRVDGEKGRRTRVPLLQLLAPRPPFRTSTNTPSHHRSDVSRPRNNHLVPQLEPLQRLNPRRLCFGRGKEKACYAENCLSDTGNGDECEAQGVGKEGARLSSGGGGGAKGDGGGEKGEEKGREEEGVGGVEEEGGVCWVEGEVVREGEVREVLLPCGIRKNPSKRGERKRKWERTCRCAAKPA